jgi:hypothetical protein
MNRDQKLIAILADLCDQAIRAGAVPPLMDYVRRIDALYAETLEEAIEAAKR